jgi:hypothetical protein
VEVKRKWLLMTEEIPTMEATEIAAVEVLEAATAVRGK